MSRTAFWILLPFLIIFVVGMLWVDIFTGGIKSVNGQIGIAGICFVVAALGFAVYDAERFRWAGKIVAAFVLFSYVAYAVEEWFFSGHSWNYALGTRSAASPTNSLWGLIEYGLPALCYLLWDRFHWRKEESPTDARYNDEDVDGDDWEEDKEHEEKLTIGRSNACRTGAGPGAADTRR